MSINNKSSENVNNKIPIYDLELNYLKNLISVNQFIDLISPVVHKYDKKAEIKLNKVLDDLISITKKEFESRLTKTVQNYSNIKNNLNKIDNKSSIDTKKKLKEIKIEIQNIGNKIKSSLVDLRKEYKYVLCNSPLFLSSQTSLLYKSTFVILISYFDFLISDLIRTYHKNYLNTLDSSDIIIKFKDLLEFKDISEYIEYVINNKVFSLSYYNLNDKKKYLKDTLGLNTYNEIINWDFINESIAIRNIIVHNNSIVNKLYLNIIKKLKNPTLSLKENDEIIITKDFLLNILYELYITGIILTQNCWRKWYKNKINESDNSLKDQLQYLISISKYEFAEKLGKYSKQITPFNLLNHINLELLYCQSLKSQNKNDELNKELTLIDTSSLSPGILLKLSGLKNDIKLFYDTLKNAISVDKIKKENILRSFYFTEFLENKDFIKNIDSFFKANTS